MQRLSLEKFDVFFESWVSEKTLRAEGVVEEVLDAQSHRAFGGVVRLAGRGVAIIFGGTDVEGHADDLVALLDQQSRSHGAVDAAGHGTQNSASSFCRGRHQLPPTA